METGRGIYWPYGCRASKELREELAQHGERPIRLVNPDTQRVYVLLEANVFERVKALLSDDAFDVRDTYAAQDAALAKVWDDPELDDYGCLKVSLELP